jgi:GntR family carbon starvation induced transcriptional regulator
MATLAQECYALIETRILNGEYRPGEKLGMQRLRDDLGIGLSPIREALSKMISSGLVQADGNKGFSVVRVTEKLTRDLSETYARIEELALRLAIEKGDANWEAKIAGQFHLLSKLEQSAEPISWSDWLPVNAAFHRAIVEGCNSDALLELRDSLVNRMHLHFRMMYNMPGWAEVNHLEHKAIYDAVMARDADSAVSLLHNHILGSLDEQLLQLNLPKD